MGRTLPTFSLYLDNEMELWRPFRRALRKEDQEIFDRLFALAKRHMAEAAYAARPVPFDTLVLTILLEQQKQIEELKRNCGLRIAECGLRNPEEIRNTKNHEEGTKDHKEEHPIGPHFPEEQ